MQDIRTFLELAMSLEINQTLAIIVIPLLILLALFELVSFFNKRKFKN